MVRLYICSDLPTFARQAEPLIEKYGDDQRGEALNAAKALETYKAEPPAPASLRGILRLGAGQDGKLGVASATAKERSVVRDSVYKLIAQLKHAQEVKGISEADKSKAKSLAKQLGAPLEYAPWWVRMLSALCLGIGTMIGHQRIVTTLGQRLGKIHLTPAQGAAAETVSSILIGISGFSGLPGRALCRTAVVTCPATGCRPAQRGAQIGILAGNALAVIF